MGFYFKFQLIIIIWVYVFMCACVGMFVCVCVCVHVGMHVLGCICGGQRTIEKISSLLLWSSGIKFRLSRLPAGTFIHNYIISSEFSIFYFLTLGPYIFKNFVKVQIWMCTVELLIKKMVKVYNMLSTYITIWTFKHPEKYWNTYHSWS